MGGSLIDDDWELPHTVNSTVVLVGRVGNGKSATGNSILGRKAFKSRASSQGVTSTCEMQTTMRKDGHVVNVIDTPGLFDFSAGSDSIGEEIVKCIDLAKNGIHAVLVVFSVRARFSREEEAALENLRCFFGDKITKYMIVVFTGGDELEENEETLSDYLGHDCPEPLKKVLNLCKRRMILFDNKTRDPIKKEQQVQELLSLVNLVIEENGGQPYSDELFMELKRGSRDLHIRTKGSLKASNEYSNKEISEQISRSYAEQLKRITEMVESKLKETAQRLEKQLAEEQAARLQAEKLASEAQKRSSDEIRQLRESLEKAKQETEDLRRRAESKCSIL